MTKSSVLSLSLCGSCFSLQLITLPLLHHPCSAEEERKWISQGWTPEWETGVLCQGGRGLIGSRRRRREDERMCVSAESGWGWTLFHTELALNPEIYHQNLEMEGKVLLITHLFNLPSCLFRQKDCYIFIFKVKSKSKIRDAPTILFSPPTTTCANLKEGNNSMDKQHFTDETASLAFACSCTSTCWLEPEETLTASLFSLSKILYWFVWEEGSLWTHFWETELVESLMPGVSCWIFFFFTHRKPIG